MQQRRLKKQKNKEYKMGMGAGGKGMGTTPSNNAMGTTQNNSGMGTTQSNMLLGQPYFNQPIGTQSNNNMGGEGLAQQNLLQQPMQPAQNTRPGPPQLSLSAYFPRQRSPMEQRWRNHMLEATGWAKPTATQTRLQATLDRGGLAALQARLQNATPQELQALTPEQRAYTQQALQQMQQPPAFTPQPVFSQSPTIAQQPQVKQMASNKPFSGRLRQFGPLRPSKT